MYIYVIFFIDLLYDTVMQFNMISFRCERSLHNLLLIQTFQARGEGCRCCSERCAPDLDDLDLLIQIIVQICQ